MIYIDTSVVLAQLLAEDRTPPPGIWGETLIASRLLEYEVWTRVHSRRLAVSHGEAARSIVARITLVELSPLVLGRAAEPFPIPIRTLDALHLATVAFLRARRFEIELATYDRRMASAAIAMGIPLVTMP